MKYCIYCGAPHEPGERFCGSCGKAIEDETPHENHASMPPTQQDGYADTVHVSSGWHGDDREDYPTPSYDQRDDREDYPSPSYEHRDYREDDPPSFGDYGFEDEAFSHPSSDEPREKGNGILIAIASVLTVAILFVAGYFIVYPHFFGDDATTSTPAGQEELTSEERVQEVMDAIENINPDLLTHEDTSVQEARALFDELSAQEQEQVTNRGVLEELEEKVQALMDQHQAWLSEEEEAMALEEVLDEGVEEVEEEEGLAFDMEALNRVITARTEARNVAVALLDLNTGELHYTANGHQQFVAAGFYAPVYVVVREYYESNTTLLNRANDMMGRTLAQIAQMNDDANAVIRGIGDLAGINRRLGSMGFTSTHFGRFFGTTGGQNYTSASEAAQILELVYQTGGYRRMSFNLASDGVNLPGNATFNAHRGSGVGNSYNVFAIVETGGVHYVVVILTDHLGQDRAVPVVTDVLREVQRQMELIHE